jgi:hypothetical protein
MGKKRYWWEKPEGKRQLKRSRHMWDDNIVMDLKEIGRGGMDWTDLYLGGNQ